MKYYILINQIVLSKTKLDLKDCAILDYLKAFCSSDDKKIRQLEITEKEIQYRYTWINFKHLIAEMPLLQLKSKASISERIQKIEKEGFIKTFRAPDRNLYVRLTEKIKDLDFSKGVRQFEQGVRPDEQGVRPGEHLGVRLGEQHKHNINSNIISIMSSKEDTESGSYGNKDINYLFDKFYEITGLRKMDGSEKRNRRYCWLLLKKIGGKKENVEALIKLAVKDPFHRANLTSFKYLYYNAVKILNQLKVDSENPRIVKIK